METYKNNHGTDDAFEKKCATFKYTTCTTDDTSADSAMASKALCATTFSTTEDDKAFEDLCATFTRHNHYAVDDTNETCDTSNAKEDDLTLLFKVPKTIKVCEDTSNSNDKSNVRNKDIKKALTLAQVAGVIRLLEFISLGIFVALFTLIMFAGSVDAEDFTFVLLSFIVPLLVAGILAFAHNTLIEEAEWIINR